MYNVDIRIVRIFNTYGPNMDKNDGRVVTKLISQIITNEDITIYGDGSQTRSFCYIDDLLEGLIRLMSSKYNYPMNIGNSSDITIKELSNILLDLIDSESNITFLPLPQDDPTNRKPDICLAKKVLDWIFDTLNRGFITRPDSYVLNLSIGEQELKLIT